LKAKSLESDHLNPEIKM